MPGTGWVLAKPDSVSIPMADGQSFVANKYLIQNGDYKSVMIYWYQGRGRAVASEYWGKVYTVIDSVRLRRSDGAIVRVTAPVITSEDTALATAIDLASATAKVLPEFVPN
jgi:EpsI family protein